MSTQTLILDEKATALARRLSALTGESIPTVVLRALGECLARVEAARRLEASSDLGRALRASAGPGIPVNHCWGDDEPRKQAWGDKSARLARLRELADPIAAHMEPGTTSDHSWLYNEIGLPK